MRERDRESERERERERKKERERERGLGLCAKRDRQVVQFFQLPTLFFQQVRRT